MIGREPEEIIKPEITVEFFYDNDNLDYVSFYLFQDGIIVEQNDNALYATNKITVHFKEDFKKLKEGEATLYETYRTCTGTATEDSQFSVIIRNTKIYEVEFDITIQKPIMVGGIMIRIKSEYLYSLQNITEITFNVVDYLGNTKNKVLSKENLNYNEINDELAVSVIYVPGELIELISFKDSHNDIKYFNHLEYNIGYDNPIVFICPPFDILGAYQCDIVLAKWGKEEYAIINTIEEIDFLSPSGSVIKFSKSDNTIIIKNDGIVINLNINHSKNYL